MSEGRFSVARCKKKKNKKMYIRVYTSPRKRDIDHTIYNNNNITCWVTVDIRRAGVFVEEKNKTIIIKERARILGLKSLRRRY